MHSHGPFKSPILFIYTHERKFVRPSVIFGGHNDDVRNVLICFLKVIERMANNLEVAGRQRTQMNGRGARLRSALELLNLVNPTDMNCILHLARFYMLYNMDLSELISTIVKLEDVRKQNIIHYYFRRVCLLLYLLTDFLLMVL